MLLIAAAAATPFLLPLIFGAAYEHAAWLTVAMLPSVLLLALVTIISQYLAAEGYPLVQVGAWVAAFVLQGALSFWLVDDYGGYGLAIALTASSLLVLVILLWQVAVTGNAAPVPTVGIIVTDAPSVQVIAYRAPSEAFRRRIEEHVESRSDTSSRESCAIRASYKRTRGAPTERPRGDRRHRE